MMMKRAAARADAAFGTACGAPVPRFGGGVPVWREIPKSCGGPWIGRVPGLRG